MYATGDENAVRILSPGGYRAAAPQASDTQIRQAAEMLAQAQRPLVISGAGVDRANANAALLDIIELLDCPVIATMAGRSSVPVDHPNWLHGYGPGGDLARTEADVVLVAGSRLGNLDVPYDKYWGDPAEKKLIQIDVDARHIGVTRPVALGIVADLGDTLPHLVAALRGTKKRPRDGKDLARYRDASTRWRDAQMTAVAAWSGPGLHPAHAMQVIGEAYGRDAVYVTDGGNTSLWAHSCLPPTQPRSYHSILELGMLGTGIPSAIGAKLGAPQREVLCVTGDGAAGFNFMEMQSAAREKLKLTTVVFAEGSWTMEEPSELAVYGRTFGTEMGTVRWDKVGEGLGCHGEYVERLADLGPALERARANAAPAVVCVRTEVAANRAVPGELFHRFFEVYQGPLG